MSVSIRMGRRSVLGLIAGLPAVRRIKGLLSGPDCDDAVQVMRLVNTAQSWHKREFGSFVTRGDLFRSPVLSRIRSDGRLERAGLGRSLLARIAIERDEVVEGWELHIRLTGAVAEPGSGYIAAMVSRRGEPVAAFASDQTGLIHSGALGARALGGPLPASVAEFPWLEVAPLGGPRRYRTLPGVLASLLLALPSIASCETPSRDCFGCFACDCVCRTSVPICCCCYGGPSVCCDHNTGSCCNVGCMSCTWCCCGTC